VPADPREAAHPESTAAFSARLKRFFSHNQYACMAAYNLFSYLLLALLSLSPNGTIGKLSPVHLEMQNNRVLSGLLRLTHLYNASSLQLQAAFFIVIPMILAGYGWAIVLFRRRERGMRQVIGFTALVCLVLVFTPPLLSKDLFSYIYYGKTISAYGMNPYEVTPQMLPDPLLIFIGRYWKNTGSVYGPLFTYFSALLTLVAGRGISANIYVFKGSMALFHMANAGLLWKLLEDIDPGRRRFGVMLYAWNPLVILMSVGGGHNDIMMMTLALLALLFLQRGRRGLFYLALSLSVMVKFVTGILLVAYLIYLMSRRQSLGKRLREAAVLVGVFLAVTAACYAPLWCGASTFKYLVQNSGLHNLFSPGGLLAALLEAVLRYLFWVPRGAAYLAGNIGSRLLLAPIFLVVLWKKPRGVCSELEMGECFFAVIMAYILTVNFFNPWYMVWAFALLPLRPWDRVSWAALLGGNLSVMWGSSLGPY